MKDKQRQSQMFGAPPPPKSETKRLIIMAVSLVILLFVFIFNLNRSMNTGNKPDVAIVDTTPTIEVKLPTLRSGELDELVDDSTEAGRTKLVPAALQLAMDDASKLSTPHYRVIGPPVLDSKLSAEIAANPSEWRLEALRVRGEVRSLRERELPSGQAYFAGSVRLDDGGAAHFLTLKLPEGLAVGQWIRIDGLFVKVYHDELDGEWLDGPLVAGRQVIDSVPPLFDPQQPLELSADGVGTFTNAELPNIINDRLDQGVGYLPFLEKWKLLARAARADQEDIDWDAVPILDETNMARLKAEPDAWRGLPVRLPLDGAALITSTSGPAEENPARIAELTDGILFEHGWKNNTEVALFLYPDKLEIPGNDHQGDPTVIGRGFFFKDKTYMARDNRLALAPLLVLSDIEVLPPPDNSAYAKLLYAVVGLTVLLIIGIFLLLRREKKRGEEFQQRRLKRLREKSQTASAT